MSVLIITDGEYKSEEYYSLINLTTKLLTEKNNEIQTWEINREIQSCMGCFGCWVKKPGECVIKDKMAELYHCYMTSDTVIFLSPIVFGQFSANIKNVIDRTLPNVLPFFYRRRDGSTMHPPRYDKYPILIIIGYGQGLDKEEVELFKDITQKHREGMAVEVYQGNEDSEKVINMFDMIKEDFIKQEGKKVQSL